MVAGDRLLTANALARPEEYVTACPPYIKWVEVCGALAEIRVESLLRSFQGEALRD